MTRTRILIADDNNESRYMIDTLLKSNGYETFSTANGEEALKLAMECCPDLIITDILMPVMDGYTFCRHLKGDDRLKGIPLIFYTATYTDERDAEFGLGLGADRYLIKPQEPLKILRVVEEVLDAAAMGHDFGETGTPLGEEMEFLRQHNEVLFRKLEQKVADLMATNAVLQREIKERQQAEAAVRESETRLKVLLECSPVGIIWADKHEGIQYVNRKFIELFGYGKSELPTFKDFFRLAYPDVSDLAAIFPWLVSIEAAGETGNYPTPFEGRLASREGCYRDVSINGACIGDICLLVFTDITEQIETRRELANAKEAAEAANLAKNRFIANMSHELRTPMTGILGAIQVALHGPFDAEQKELLRIAGNSGKRLVKILNDILDLTRLETGNLPLENREFILSDCVAEMKEIFMPEALCKGLELVHTSTSDLPYKVIGDKTRLQQILGNLVGNAVKFTDRGRVEISVREGDVTPDGKREIVFTVKDSGVGIPADKKEKIFDFFTQADESYTRRFGGIGVGLTISRELAARLGGRIGFESEEGVGSMFFIVIPLENSGALR